MTKPQINVTPLIDVLLVLLIIFMVVTPMKPSAFDARVPEEPNPNPLIKTHPDTLVVTIDVDSSLRLNQDQLAATVGDTQVLTERLRFVFDQRGRNAGLEPSPNADPSLKVQRSVFIKAPRSLDYGSVAKVVDAVKTAGADPVSLLIDGLD